MCATIEELLNLGDEGWQKIANMDDEALEDYLKDIKSLEEKIKQSTIYKNKDNEDIGDSNNPDFDNSNDDNDIEDDALAKLKKDVEDPDSPFEKRRKKVKKKRRDKILSTYDIDLEAKKIAEELGFE